MYLQWCLKSIQCNIPWQAVKIKVHEHKQNIQDTEIITQQVCSFR